MPSLKEKLTGVMAPLVKKPHFADWMALILGCRDRTFGEFGSFQTLADKRVVTATLAEFGVYEDVIAVYEEAHPGWVREAEEAKGTPDKQEQEASSLAMLVTDAHFQELMTFFYAECRKERERLRAAKTDKTQLEAIGVLNAYRSILDVYRGQLMPVNAVPAEQS